MKQYVCDSFKVGYNNIPWIYSKDKSDIFFINATANRPLLSVREECINAAIEISNKFHKEQIHIVYSGGRDSDFILESFRLAGADIKAIMIQAENQMNINELYHASEFEIRTGFNNFDLNIINHFAWIESEEYRLLLESVECPYSSFFWYISGILNKYKDKILIFGPMEPAFALFKGYWALAMPEFEYSIFKLFDKLDLVGVPSFFCWSGELWNSFLLSKTYQAVLNNKTDFTSSNQAKGVLLESEFGHRSRNKNIIHNKPEFWVNRESINNRMISHSVSGWLKERQLV